MTLSRRHLFAVAPATLIGAAGSARSRPVAQEAPTACPAYFADFVGPDFRQDSDRAASIGSGSPHHDEVAVAVRLLLGASKYDTPLAVARYFKNIKEKNIGGEPYTQEWSKRGNPLITGFFSMTQTAPSDGDETPWCAAFVSFCLYAAGRPSELTARARGYVGYQKRRPVTNPRPGDLAVLQRGEGRNGHVGFFTRDQLDANGAKTGKFMMLGGNQGNAISEIAYPRPGTRLLGFYSVD